MDSLEFAHQAIRLVVDPVKMRLHYIQQHHDQPWTYVRILFVNFSLLFNTLIPDIFSCEVSQLVVSFVFTQERTSSRHMDHQPLCLNCVRLTDLKNLTPHYLDTIWQNIQTSTDQNQLPKPITLLNKQPTFVFTFKKLTSYHIKLSK